MYRLAYPDAHLDTFSTFAHQGSLPAHYLSQLIPGRSHPTVNCTRTQHASYSVYCSHTPLQPRVSTARVRVGTNLIWIKGRPPWLRKPCTTHRGKSTRKKPLNSLTQNQSAKRLGNIPQANGHAASMTMHCATRPR